MCPCYPIGPFYVRPAEAQPISEWEDRNVALVDLVERLRNVWRELASDSGRTCELLRSGLCRGIV